MTTSSRHYRRSLIARQRRGAMMILVLASSALLLMVAVFSVDYVYMQLVRTELRAAVDLAAKAGAAALYRDMDTNTVKQETIRVAQLNDVGGKGLDLDASQVILGRSMPGGNGAWNFVAGAQPYNAVRINTALTAGSKHGPVNLFFGQASNTPFFEPRQVSTASFYTTDVALVLDRSHSMCFDNTGTTWSYPAGIPAPNESIKFPPHNTGSRWAALYEAVQLFVSVCNEARVKPKVSLTTWASELGVTSVEYALTGLKSPVISRDTELSQDYQPILNSLADRTTKPMIGGTNMAAGIDDGIAVLTAPNATRAAQKIMILMTDGEWNLGRSPIEAANDARARGIVIHTIVYPSTTNPATTRQIAEITGGYFYHAANPEQLREAFRKLALSIPVILTD